MRRWLWLVGILVCLAGTSARAQANKAVTATAPAGNAGPIRFEVMRLHQQYGNDCRTDFPYASVGKGVCMSVSLEYPKVTSAPNTTVSSRITQVIDRWALQEWCVEGYKTAKTPETLVQDFVDREKVLRNAVSGDAPWAKDNLELFDRKVKVDYESANVLSLEDDEECIEIDGQHDEGGIDYLNFRPSTAEPIRLEDIMMPGFEKRLNSIAEVRFRAQYKLGPNTSFHEALFWFPQDRFQLNRDFSIGAEGLTFFYHRDEFGPSARGGASFFLPYADFRTLIRPDAHIP